jgi:S-adenosylmethionine-diacylgycerolhomoserine-N-methlytransferase
MRTVEADISARMDRIYRPQRLIYDLTRKYYLLGRDPLLERIAALPGEVVVEIGCGTGRNLIRLGQMRPDLRLVGIEPSNAMLETARRSLDRHRCRATLVQGSAETITGGSTGIGSGADHVLFSYVLSMLEQPAPAIDRALALLGPGGSLHVADFGDLAGWPAWAQAGLRTWLRWFHVWPRPDAGLYLQRLERAGRGRLHRRSLLGGYAELMSFTKA